MFVFSNFEINNKRVQLTFPEVEQAKELYSAIKDDRESLSRWMPWTKSTKSAGSERNFIKYAREQNAKYLLLEHVIVVDGVASGMIDLHDISWEDHTAKIGYWLHSQQQGYGIMTESLKRLVEHAFSELKLNKLVLQAESENEKSIAIAKRLGFVREGALKQQVAYGDEFKDLNIYGLLNE